MISLERVLSTDGFMPHGMCYLWRPGILALHVVSDSLITLAYFSIPFTLIYFTRKRRDLRFTWMFMCFAIFIVACGATHFMDIWTIWHPTYWLSGGVKALTALASVPTAVLLIKLVPAALRIPNPSALEAANAALAREVTERRHAEGEIRELNASLEARIAERTAQLSAANQILLSEARERKQSDALLRLTLASIQDGVIVSNDGDAITFMNDAAAELLGRRAADAVNSPVASTINIVHAATRARLRLGQGSAMPDQASIAEDMILIGDGGREVPIDLRAAPLQSHQTGVAGMVYTLRDHSDRRREEETRQQMAALVESADDAIIMKGLDGAIRSWNPAAQRLLGYRSDEIIGQPITRLLPESRQDEESLILAKLRDGESVAHFETVRRRKDGSLVDVSLTISPIRDRAGRVVGASKIMRDITDRKLYVEQLRSLNAELQRRVLARTSELLERDAMLQEIHHRVKNNLQVISSLINMQARTIQDGEIRTALAQCRSRVETMAQIHGMLYQSKDYARVPFWKYVRELTTRVLSAAGLSPGGIAVVYEMTEISLPVQQAIPCALILNELVSNALKHAFPSGIGTIRIGLRHLSDDRILLSVADDGIGISPEFEPRESKSLGVQLVFTLARQLDACLEIIRHPGSAFHLTFAAVSGT
ncbi:MAG TPA: PAS domain S-box protein [Steroidobacteraceae bacterium]|nr:PAS domain S-box protein [Steroidobacteraceae bacterium]